MVFTSFDFVDPTFRGWKAAPALWRDLLRCGNDAISPRDLLAANTTPYQNGGLRMVDALAGKQASAAPNIWHIGGFLAAYILLLVPINYFLLKRLDRREMAWVSIPVLIIGFTATSYVMALGIKGGLLSANRTVIVETTANSNQAAAYGQLTIYSPRRSSYDIDIASPSGDAHAFTPREIFAPGGGINGDLTIDSTAGAASIRGAMIRLWDKRSFDSPLPVTVGGGIEATTRVLPNKRVQVIVTNKTPYALQNCALIADDENIEIGALAPGQASKPHEIKWATRVAATSIPLHSQLPLTNSGAASRSNLGGLEKIPTRDKITTALANTLGQGGDQNGYNPYGESGRGYGRSINAFVGWFSDPLMNVQIDGKPAASGEEVNLLVAHLPAPPNAPTAPHWYTNPFDTRPVLNLEDELPPGARKAGRSQ